MAGRKLTDATIPLATNADALDLLYLVDVSDTSESPQGTSKKIEWQNLLNNTWGVNGNAGTNPITNFIGTTDNQNVTLKTNNQVLGTLYVPNSGITNLELGVDGSPNSSLTIFGVSQAGNYIPAFISGSVTGKTWGVDTNGQTIRINQGDSYAFGGQNYYDIGIDQNLALYFTGRNPVGLSNTNLLFLDSDKIGVNIGWGLSLDPSAVFQIDDTTRGFLPPRMTSIEKISIIAPATGLIVYDTTLQRLCFYDSITWVTL